MLSTLGNVKLDKLTAPVLQKWKTGIEDKGLALQTKQGFYKEFRSFLDFARTLGHSKIEITWNTYSHLYPREEERAVNILNKIV